MTDDDLDEMGRLARDRYVSTHWDGCHRSHPRCAVLALVAEVRRLRAAVPADRERIAAELGAEAAVWRTMSITGLSAADVADTLEGFAAAVRRGPGPTDYVGRRPCGCVSYLSSGECDDRRHIRSTRRDVVKLVEAGVTVARMPRAAWEKLPWECPVCQGGPGRKPKGV